MTARKTVVLIESSLVLAATAGSVVGMIHLKDRADRAEAMHVMSRLGDLICDYRERTGLLPSQDVIDVARTNLDCAVHIGQFQYRARWIGPDAEDGTILAYFHKRHPSLFLKDGYVVLYLDGRVEWLPCARFDPLLATQQSPMEAAALKK